MNEKQKKPGSGPGVASLIMGMIALVLFLMFINIPLAILSIVLGVIGIAGYERKGAAIVGMACAVLSLVLFIGSWAIMFGNDHLLSVAEDLYLGDGMQEYYEMMEEL